MKKGAHMSVHSYTPKHTTAMHRFANDNDAPRDFMTIDKPAGPMSAAYVENRLSQTSLGFMNYVC